MHYGRVNRSAIIRVTTLEGIMKVLVFCSVLYVIVLSWSFPAYAYTDYGDTVEVTVVMKDNLINICGKLLEEPRRWGIIAKINKLKNPNLIFPGQKLVIPVDMLRGVPLDGVVTFVSGDVRAQSKEGGEWKTLHINDRVKQGSSIRTGDESGVEVSFEEGDSFLMRSNSSLVIRAAKKRGLINFLQKLFLSAGRTITRVKEATGRKSRFEIQTPSAVAVARGTSFRVGLDDKETMRSEVLKGLVDVEAMAKKVEVHEGEGTLAKKNEPPAAPRKLLPPPMLLHAKALYTEMPLVFQFSEIEGALAYRIMVSRDGGGRDVVKEKVIATGEKAEIVGVDDGEYFLISQSIDAERLEGLPSDPATFRLRINPLPPVILSPGEGANLRANTIEFKWLEAKDAVSYHVQIAEDREFSRLVVDRNGITETGLISPTLGFTGYFFRVSSIARDGYEGIFSRTGGFTLIAPPGTPVIEKPEISAKEIRFRWKSLGEGVTYRFQMSSDNEFKNIMMDKRLETPEATLPRPNDAGKYFFRAKGIDSKGYEGDFSFPQSYQIQKIEGLLYWFVF
ncbi:MAG TPA: FecR domain-containing protein [Thermodesulfovibrionales bacterium]|nr:FecR domain-containing protein [Thermodesulfovibrionales bacterium]